MQPTKFVPMKTPLSQAILDNWNLDAAPKFRLSVSDLLAQESSKGRHVGLIIGGQAAVATQGMQSCHMARAYSPQLALACMITCGYISTDRGLLAFTGHFWLLHMKQHFVPLLVPSALPSCAALHDCRVYGCHPHQPMLVQTSPTMRRSMPRTCPQTSLMSTCSSWQRSFLSQSKLSRSLTLPSASGSSTLTSTLPSTAPTVS